MPIFLYDQDPQVGPVNWHRLQLLEPFFGSTSQIQLSDLEELVSIEVMHFGNHGKSLRPIIHILMISSPEQLIHSLRTRQLLRSSVTQQKCSTPLHTQLFNSKTDVNKVDQNLSSCNTVLILEKGKTTKKTDVVRVTHQTRIEHPQLSVSEVQSWMEQW
jgi:hypothetical protein